MYITDEEIFLLEKVLEYSKLDKCYEFGSNENDEIKVVDYEQDKLLSLEQGIVDIYNQTKNVLVNYFNSNNIAIIKRLYHTALVALQLDKERLSTLLYNALVLLESSVLNGQSMLDTELLDEINITKDEYNYILNNVDNQPTN